MGIYCKTNLSIEHALGIATTRYGIIERRSRGENEMKKLLLVLALVSMLAACSNDDEKQAQAEAKEMEELLDIKTDEKFVEEIKSNKVILDATYSILEGMGIATLTITVDESVTKEQAKKIAAEQEKGVCRLSRITTCCDSKAK